MNEQSMSERMSQGDNVDGRLVARKRSQEWNLEGKEEKHRVVIWMARCG